MKYRIVKADSESGLEKQVNALIEQGWQLQGGVGCSLSIEHAHIEHSSHGDKHAVGTFFHELWAQAMVREK